MEITPSNYKKMAFIRIQLNGEARYLPLMLTKNENRPRPFNKDYQWQIENQENKGKALYTLQELHSLFSKRNPDNFLDRKDKLMGKNAFIKWVMTAINQSLTYEEWRMLGNQLMYQFSDNWISYDTHYINDEEALLKKIQETENGKHAWASIGWTKTLINTLGISDTPYEYERYVISPRENMYLRRDGKEETAHLGFADTYSTIVRAIHASLKIDLLKDTGFNIRAVYWMKKGNNYQIELKKLTKKDL